MFLPGDKLVTVDSMVDYVLVMARGRAEFDFSGATAAVQEQWKEAQTLVHAVKDGALVQASCLAPLGRRLVIVARRLVRAGDFLYEEALVGPHKAVASLVAKT